MYVSERSVPHGRMGWPDVCMGMFQCDACDRLFEKRLPPWFRSRLVHFCSRKCINKNRKHSIEQRHRLSERITGEHNPFWGKTHTDAAKTKMSENAWSRGLSNDDPKRLSWLQRLSEANSGSNNPFFGKIHSLRTREKMSKTRAEKIAKGEIFAQSHGRYGLFASRKAGSIRYDSAYEYVRMIILDDDPDVIAWTKHHNIKIPYVVDGKSRFYVPDFWVHRVNGIFVEELKGYEPRLTLEAKMNALESFCHENKMTPILFRTADVEQMALEKLGKTLKQIRKELSHE